MNGTKTDGFDWRFPIFGLLAAITVAFPQLTFGHDIVALLATMVLIVVMGLFVISVAVRKVRRHRLAVLSMVCVFVVLAWSLLHSADHLRTIARWLLYSRDYKAQVLNQLPSADGSLQHVEWDGWGFPGAGNTVVYLVFDPNDRLAEASRKHLSGKFSGVPCEVYRVRRLERSWYTILFYTEMDWQHCS